MRIKVILVILLGVFISGAGLAESATTSCITQWGITWHFDKAYEYGQFANGDYWVLGPLTITRIEPDFDGDDNGWEVNPSVGNTQGFQSNAGGFDSALVPSLPYYVTGTKSIVKEQKKK